MTRYNQHTPKKSGFPAISPNTADLIGTRLVFQVTAGEKVAKYFPTT